MPGKDKELTLGDRLRSFDFYKDLPKELSEPSMSGASMSMFAVILLGALFISQLAQFLSYQKTSEIVIDASSGMEKLNINIDITLGKCPCHILSLDIVDVTGVHVVDVQGKVNKIRLDKNGNQLGQKDMIQEIQQSNQHNHETILKLLKQGLEDQEGCRIQGTVVINKVPGNFHISTHAFGHVVQLFYQGGGKLDFSHHIHHLSFGDDGMNKELQDRFGETFTYDLDGIKVDQANFIMFGQILANYYLEVNEMEYEDKSMGWSKKITGFKHKASRSILAQLGLPALFFKYELSPIKLKYTITNKSVIEFFVNISAIIGGVFTVASILESLVRNTLSMVSPHDKKT